MRYTVAELDAMPVGTVLMVNEQREIHKTSIGDWQLFGRGRKDAAAGLPMHSLNSRFWSCHIVDHRTGFADFTLAGGQADG